MMLGKYGIGLLGFWSVGRRMEIRARVRGSVSWALHLEEDVPDAFFAPVRAGHLPIEDTFTEVLVTEVHAAAAAAVKPKRLAAYLAGEMRGQLIERGTRLEIHDRVARGRAAKLLVVRPKKFQGAPLSDLTELPVPGCASARVDLYLVSEGEGRGGHVALACGGATVLDDLALLDGPEAPREPWSSGRFEGVVDFPDLEVAPGARRGFVPDEAAHAFVEALPGLEARLKAVLAEEAAQRTQAREQEDVRSLRRLFRSLPRLLPHYALLDVENRAEHATAAPDPDEGAAAGNAPRTDADVASYPPPPHGAPGAEPGLAAGVEASAEPLSPAPPPEPVPDPRLYPPGPLVSVAISPRESRVPVEGERRLAARAKDGDGRRIEEAVEFQWTLAGPGTLEAGRWEVNSGHPDYRRAQGDARARLRYLVHLFAKEVVVRNFGSPSEGPLLERMVEILTHVGEGRVQSRPAPAPPSP